MNIMILTSSPIRLPIIPITIYDLRSKNEGDYIVIVVCSYSYILHIVICNELAIVFSYYLYTL